jgi:hypothetical protein
VVSALASHGVGEVDQLVQAARAAVVDQVIGADVIVDESPRTALGWIGDATGRVWLSPRAQV